MFDNYFCVFTLCAPVIFVKQILKNIHFVWYVFVGIKLLNDLVFKFSFRLHTYDADHLAGGRISLYIEESFSSEKSNHTVHIFFKNPPTRGTKKKNEKKVVRNKKKKVI